MEQTTQVCGACGIATGSAAFCEPCLDRAAEGETGMEWLGELDCDTRNAILVDRADERLRRADEMASIRGTRAFIRAARYGGQRD